MAEKTSSNTQDKVQSQVPQGNPSTAGLEDFKEVRRTKKGAVESADIKARFKLAEDQPINHIACNQT